MYKNHLKIVKGCRIDTGQYKKALSKKDPPKTPGTRVSSKTGTWLDGQRARQAKGKTGIGLHIHEARWA